MAQQLRILAIPLEDPTLVPGTIWQPTTVYNCSRGSDALSQPLWVPNWFIYMQPNTHTHKKYNLNSKNLISIIRITIFKKQLLAVSFLYKRNKHMFLRDTRLAEFSPELIQWSESNQESFHLQMSNGRSVGCSPRAWFLFLVVSNCSKPSLSPL